LSEVIAHTVIALVVMIGGFVMMVISMVDGRPIPDTTMNLLTVLMSGVVGWFFGTHATLSGMYAQQSAPTAPAAPAAPAEHENAAH
jgi:hypothetical protein